MTIKRILIAIGLALSALYPIYTNFYNSHGVDQYEHQMQFINRGSSQNGMSNSQVLMPLTVEGLYFVYNHTVNRVIDIEKKVTVNLPGDEGTKYENTRKMLTLMKTPGFIRYNIVFVTLRFLLHIAIFFMCFKLYRLFIQNDWIIIWGLMFVSLSMGNSIYNSDLSLVTYMDILLFLVTAYLALTRQRVWWIVPIAVVGAMNSLVAPFLIMLLFVTKLPVSGLRDRLSVDWNRISSNSVIACTLAVAASVGTQPGIHYFTAIGNTGLTPIPGENPVAGFGSFQAVRAVFENFGTFSILPLVCILAYRKLEPFFRLNLLFVALPYLIVQFWMIPGSESRVSMIPTFALFLPAVLALLGKSVGGFQDQHTILSAEPS